MNSPVLQWARRLLLASIVLAVLAGCSPGSSSKTPDTPAAATTCEATLGMVCDKDYQTAYDKWGNPLAEFRKLEKVSSFDATQVNRAGLMACLYGNAKKPFDDYLVLARQWWPTTLLEFIAAVWNGAHQKLCPEIDFAAGQHE